MMQFIFGIIVGIILSETGCLPIIQDYITELLQSFNNLREV